LVGLVVFERGESVGDSWYDFEFNVINLNVVISILNVL